MTFASTWQGIIDWIRGEPIKPVTPPIPAKQLMKASQDAIDLIKSFEGCRLEAYKDGNGILTIGWGHTGDDVVWNTKWTQDYADYKMLQDVQKKAVQPLNRMIDVTLSQNQFDALVSLCYNIGQGHFSTSRVLGCINKELFYSVPEAILEWDLIGGNPSAGLKRRRKAEVALWLKS